MELFSHFRHHVFLMLLLLVGLATLLLSFGGDQGLLQVIHLKRQKAALNARIQVLDQENEKLRSEVWRLQNDPLAVEQIAREKLGLVRPGEKVLRVR